MELEAKHLVSYLPYELKFGSGNQKYHEFVLSGINFNTRTDIQIRTRGNRIYKISDLRFKPLLRPLSDLTKESGNHILDFRTGERIDILSLPYFIVEKLIECHFDVFGLIDQGLALPLI